MLLRSCRHGVSRRQLKGGPGPRPVVRLPRARGPWLSGFSPVSGRSAQAQVRAAGQLETRPGLGSRLATSRPELPVDAEVTREEEEGVGSVLGKVTPAPGLLSLTSS